VQRGSVVEPHPRFRLMPGGAFVFLQQRYTQPGPGQVVGTGAPNYAPPMIVMSVVSIENFTPSYSCSLTASISSVMRTALRQAVARRIKNLAMLFEHFTA